MRNALDMQYRRWHGTGVISISGRWYEQVRIQEPMVEGKRSNDILQNLMAVMKT
jgi:hypothetical protein